MIFIDTGAFLARYLKRDQHHHAAVAAWDALLDSAVPCFTSNFVVSETLTLLARRTTYEFAAARARSIYASDNVHILRPDAPDEITAVQHFEKYSDQQMSFCDCVSFALMRRIGISDAFAFDKHFHTAGFQTLP